MTNTSSHRTFDEIASFRCVVGVIAERVADGFGHNDPRREMCHGVDVLGRHDALDQVLVAEVSDHEPNRVGHGRAEAGREVVDHDDLFAGIEQSQHHVAADVAGAPRDQDGHPATSRSFSGDPLAFKGAPPMLGILARLRAQCRIAARAQEPGSSPFSADAGSLVARLARSDGNRMR